MPALITHLLPSSTAEKSQNHQGIGAGEVGRAGKTVVVIDVLRASTTITTALQNGARAILPFVEIGQARREKQQQPTETLLAGERQGLRINGFDFGNSPNSYSSERVTSRTILLTTTNGTQALHTCQEAREVLIGPLVNGQTLVDYLLTCSASTDIHFLCAGTNGQLSTEDVLCAGMLAERLLTSLLFSRQPLINPATRLALSLAVTHGQTLALLKESPGGQNLLRLGFESDIIACSRYDTLSVIPIWNPTTNEITAPSFTS